MKTVYDIAPDIDKHRRREAYEDIPEPAFWEVVERSKRYSLLSVEAFYNLYRAIEYVALNRVPGDIVECGVFLGGAVLAMSEFAVHFGLRDRTFFLYDTFAGFPKHSEETDFYGKPVRFGRYHNFQATVERVLQESNYPEDRFQLIPGPVEETLQGRKPEQISVLRLDTDYYESTLFELKQLYPRLTPGGVLVVDDYGHFKGARRATDEFFEAQVQKPLLVRVNYTVYSGVKPR